MKRIKERLLSLLLTVCMVLSLLSAFTVEASAGEWTLPLDSIFIETSGSHTRDLSSCRERYTIKANNVILNLLSPGNPSNAPITVLYPVSAAEIFTVNIVLTGNTDIGVIKGTFQNGNINVQSTPGEEQKYYVYVNVYRVGSKWPVKLSNFARYTGYESGNLVTSEPNGPNSQRLTNGPVTCNLNIIDDYATNQYGATMGSATGIKKEVGGIKIYMKAYSGTVTTNNSDADIKVGSDNIINGASSYTIPDIAADATRAVTAEPYVGSSGLDFVDVGTISASNKTVNVYYHPVTFSSKGTGGTGNLGIVKAYCGSANISSGRNVLNGQTVSFTAETYSGSGFYKSQSDITVNNSVNKSIQYYSVNYKPVYGAGTGSGNLGIVNAYCGSSKISSGTYVLNNETVTYKAESFAGSNTYIDSSDNSIAGNIDRNFQYYPVNFGNNGTSYGTVTASCEKGGNISATGTNVLKDQKVTFTATPSLTRTSYIKSINDGVFNITNLKGATKVSPITAATPYNVTFGNWEAELNAALNGAITPAAKAGVLHEYFDGTDHTPNDNYRAILNGLFTGMPGVMAKYDDVTHKYSVIEQYLAKMGTAEAITTDFGKGASSDFAKMVNAQLALEEPAAKPAVSVNNTTGVLTITAPIPTVNYDAVTVGASSLKKTGGTTWTYTLTPADINAGYVEITCKDINGYKVKEKYTVTKTVFSAEQITAALTPVVGGEMDINMKPGDGIDATLSESNKKVVIYSLSDPLYEKSGSDLVKAWQPTISLNDGPAVLTVRANNNGAYFRGFKVGSVIGILDTTAAEAELGAGATIVLSGSAVDPADQIYKLTCTPAGVTDITAQYRNLLGEVNLAENNDQLKEVIGDAKYALVMHDGTGKTINKDNGGKTSTTITGEIAKNAFNDLDNAPPHSG